MELNNKKFLINKGLTNKFLPDDFIKEKIYCDYDQKIKTNPNYTIFESASRWINRNLEYSHDEEFRANNKFNRSAQEIWESGKTTGCTDYAIVFATFLRQLNIPTTILHTMSEEFVLDIQSGKNSRYIGHAFCECYFNNKWILVDPTNNKIMFDYNKNKICLDYLIHNRKNFIVCERVDEIKPYTIKTFNEKMYELSKQNTKQF